MKFMRDYDMKKIKLIVIFLCGLVLVGCCNPDASNNWHCDYFIQHFFVLYLFGFVLIFAIMLFIEYTTYNEETDAGVSIFSVILTLEALWTVVWFAGVGDYLVRIIFY